MPVEHPASGGLGEHRPRATALTGTPPGELPHEVRERLGQAVRTRDRLQGLLDAVLSVASGLELDSTLHRIVRAATELVDARYGALGVLGEDGDLAGFVHSGLDPETGTRTEWTNGGRGPLGGDPRPGRPAGPSRHPAPEAFSRPHPRTRGVLGVPVRVRGTVFGTLYLTGKRGDAGFSAEDEAVLRALAAAAGVAVDNARLFERSRTRERWLGAVAEVNGALLGGASVDATLELIARRVCALARADGTCILLAPDEDSAAVSVSVSTGEGAGPLMGLSVDPTSDSPVAQTLRDGTSRLLPELTAALPEEARRSSSGLGPAVAVPLSGAEGPGGLLIAVRSKGAAPFGEEQMPMLTSLADQAAVALEFADKQRNQRLLDLLADRDRIAQDLHDHVIQRLFVTGMGLQGTLRRIGDEHVRQRVEQVVDQLDRTVREIRTSIFDLHTTAAHHPVSPRRRLLDVVAELSTGSTVSPSMRISGAVDTFVSPEIAEHAEAVLREALSNALRHSGGDRIRVAVDASGSALEIEVADNGVGIPPDVRRSGLDTMRVRARQCGGTLDLGEEPGGGTRVTWRVPPR